ncbi:MAG TPA: protein-disulfide reductase DsbD domain-containing protein [Candidatus Acidoferrales bacterium]|nr:protein-disulfide reductase DsbD domain-containing protein [Candidatus Acidoferrales bacterium]
MRRWLAALTLAGLAAGTWSASAQSGPALARSVVQAEAFASLEPVPRGRTFDIAVVAEIKPAYHINAHKVLDEFLIPTEIEPQFPAGLRVVSTDYPAGELRKFSFSPDKLAVYSGKVTLRLKVEAGAAAPLGPRDLPLELRYQACNDSMCLPPVKLPVSVHIVVAKAGTLAKPVHPEVFRR